MNLRRLKHTGLAVIGATTLLFGPATMSYAQELVPQWLGFLLLGFEPLMADSASTQEELPGLGHKFELLFAMMDDEDPQNPTNDVISVSHHAYYTRSGVTEYAPRHQDRRIGPSNQLEVLLSEP